jgi:hypothetical protein
MAGCANVAGMNGGLRVFLELDLGRGSIQGRIGPADGALCGFAGYVQLISQLEGLRSAGEPAEMPPPINGQPSSG